MHPKQIRKTLTDPIPYSYDTHTSTLVHRMEVHMQSKTGSNIKSNYYLYTNKRLLHESREVLEVGITVQGVEVVCQGIMAESIVLLCGRFMID